MKYTAFGEIREMNGSSPTDYLYTGQRKEVEFGLSYYVARWYDSSTGHFVQADTIIPAPGVSSAWDRYAYVLNNPLKYTDSSGHWIDPYDPGAPPEIHSEWENNSEYKKEHREYIIDFNPYIGCLYGIIEWKQSMEQDWDPYITPFIEVQGKIKQIYLDEGIDLDTMAKYSQENPLSMETVEKHLTHDEYVIFMTNITYAMNHIPYALFLQNMEKINGFQYSNQYIYNIDNEKKMQFEPNYLNALMENHKDVLNISMKEIDTVKAENEDLWDLLIEDMDFFGIGGE